MVTFRGETANKCRAELYYAPKPRFPVPKFDLSVPAASVYKYLGTMVDRSANMDPEVPYRSNQQSGALGTLKKHVFGHPHINTVVRVKCAKSLCSSRLLYNAEAWWGMTAVQRDNLDHSTPTLSLFGMPLAVLTITPS